MIEFKLPSLGADMDEGKLLQWKVGPGDQVKRGDVVAVVDTSKAAVDVEIWDAGTIHELVVQPGETVPVGTVLARLLATGESAPTAAPRPAPPGAAAAKAVRPEARPAEGKPTARQSVPAAPVAGRAAAGRLRVSPAARRRAEALGVELDGVVGTGPDRAITLRDVESAAEAVPAGAGPAGERAAPHPAPPEVAREPVTPEPVSPQSVAPDKAGEMRRAIAAAMSRSKREIPHYYLSDLIPLRRAVDWLQGENAQRAMTERILMAALLIKAVARACRDFPDMNGHFVEGEFRPSEAAHVGVAIALRQGGLVAPAILSAERKSVGEVMKDLADLVRRARIGSLRSSELSAPTITVTHLGEQGVDAVFGVIYSPQVALVGFGRVGDRVVVENGGVFVLPATTASLSADHRVSDGHRGALFLAAVHRLLQEPEEL